MRAGFLPMQEPYIQIRSRFLDTADLQHLLHGLTPVTNLAGFLRVEVMGERGNPNHISWVHWEAATRLLTIHGDRAALLTIDASESALPSDRELL